MNITHLDPMQMSIDLCSYGDTYRPYTVLVCGGRTYDNYDKIAEVLDHLDEEQGIDVVVQGGAKGADRLAKEWAYNRNIQCIQEDADWDRYKKKAGFLRNKKMLEMYKPDIVIAFPGGNGTAHMCRIAEEAGVEVVRIEDAHGV